MRCPTGGRPIRRSRAKIIDSHHPAEPAAAAPDRLDGLAEGHLVGCRMIKNRDQLEVVPVGQRQGLVTGPEARMESTVAKGGTEARAQPARALFQAFRSRRKGQVVQMHGHILARLGVPGGTGAVRDRAVQGTGAGSAACRSSRPGRASKSSHSLSSISYARAPISATSSALLLR